MRITSFGLIAVGLLVHVPQASASIITYTYTGTVSYGYDTTGVFGAAGTSLTGQTFTAVENFDTSKFRYTNSDGSTFSYQMGGSSYGPDAAGAKATISIGGSAAKAIASTKDSTQNTIGVSTTSIEQARNFINSAGNNDFYEESVKFTSYSPAITFDYTKSFALSASGGAAFSGSYSLSAYVLNSGSGSYESFAYAFANLQPTALTVTTAVSAVPLPASAPMFGSALVAFSVFGYGLSRRNKTTTA